ncbi:MULTISPECIES: hypothetical protein [Capnocytophaga]|nr:hypothetical protein [Capnocytophaga cynodegmi]
MKNIALDIGANSTGWVLVDKTKSNAEKRQAGLFVISFPSLLHKRIPLHP